MGESSVTSPEKGTNHKRGEGKTLKRITIWVFLVCFIIGFWYVLADRYTPTTNQAIVNGYVIPIVPEISGSVTEVVIGHNEMVEAGSVLVKIDAERYQLQVEQAEIELVQAGQELGTDTASVAKAQAALIDAEARLSNAEKDIKRITPLVKEGLIAQSDYDQAEVNLKQATAGVQEATAELERAESQLGAVDEENTQIRAALNKLAQAKVNLRDTTIVAPTKGGVTNLQIGIGHYAKAGVPLLTFVSGDAIWVEARLRENNLGQIKKGDKVEIALDIAPGKVFQGEIMSIGYGVSNNLNTDIGALPTIKSSSGWLREPQRFPVIIKFSDDESYGFRRIGGQAKVTVYTGENFILNGLSKVGIRFSSLLSYFY